MTKETWADIPDWEGCYQASSDGRVRSLDRLVMQDGKWGPYARTMKGRILRPSYCTNGYTFVVLSKPKRPPCYSLIHRLVAFAFLGQPAHGQEVRHLNGVRDDNRLANLQWASRSENHADKLAHGTHNRDERNHQAKLTVHQVHEIRLSTLSQLQLSKIYGVSVPTISEIRSGKAWSWLNTYSRLAP